MKIDRETMSKLMRDCWPIIDKKQEAQFYKTVFEWFKGTCQVCFTHQFIFF